MVFSRLLRDLEVRPLGCVGVGVLDLLLLALPPLLLPRSDSTCDFVCLPLKPEVILHQRLHQQCNG